MEKRKKLNNDMEETIFNVLVVLIFFGAIGYIFMGCIFGLRNSLEIIKKRADLQSTYVNNENTDYVLTETIYLKDISSDTNNLIQSRKVGNSKIGKFFIQDTEEKTSQQVVKKELYYFVETKDGLQRKNFKKETGKELTSEQVFFKEISSNEQPKIEVKTKEFAKKDLEKQRRSFGIEEKSYTIFLPYEDIKKLQGTWVGEG